MGRILVLKRAELRTVQASASVVPPALTSNVADPPFNPIPTLPLAASIVSLSALLVLSMNESRGSDPAIFAIEYERPLLVLSTRMTGLTGLDKCRRVEGVVMPIPTLPEFANDTTAVPGPSTGIKSKRPSA